MFRLLHLLRTSIGSKLMMAASGLVLVLFITGHMIGNLAVFQGQASLNQYAAWLQGHPLLWGIRLGMVSVFLLHIFVGLRLALENRRARTRRYRLRVVVQTGFAARSMVLSGLMVLAFVVYHLLHLTLGVVQPQYAHLLDGAGLADVYSRVVLGFQDPRIAWVYAVAVSLLGLHLWHAVRSLFQTLGVRHDAYRRAIDLGSAGFSLLLVAGFLSIPAAVRLGVVTLPGSLP